MTVVVYGCDFGVVAGGGDPEEMVGGDEGSGWGDFGERGRERLILEASST